MDDPNARLIPPPAEEYTVPVTFRFIGEESPRVWTGLGYASAGLLLWLESREAEQAEATS